MSTLKDLHDIWMSDPEYREAYDALGEEYSLVQAMVRAWIRTETDRT